MRGIALINTICLSRQSGRVPSQVRSLSFDKDKTLVFKQDSDNLVTYLIGSHIPRAGHF